MKYKVFGIMPSARESQTILKLIVNTLKEQQAVQTGLQFSDSPKGIVGMVGCNQMKDRVHVYLKKLVSIQQAAIRGNVISIVFKKDLPWESPPLGIWLTYDPFYRGIKPQGLVLARSIGK